MPEAAAADWFLEILAPRDEQGKRRTELLQAAFDVIAEAGFEGLRTRGVAERAGVNVATLHYYFPSKQDLVEGLALFIGAKFVTLHGPAPKPSGFPALDRLRQEFSDSGYYLKHCPEMILVMQEFALRGKRDPQVQKVVDRMMGHWRKGIGKLVREGIADGTFRGDIEPPAMLGILMAILGGAAATGSDQLDAIQRYTESWILSDTARKQVKRTSGARA